MSKESVNTLSDAIKKLESASNSKSEQVKAHIEKDFEEIKRALDEMRPYFEDIKSKVESETKATKNHLESKVKENPWITIGIFGLVAFFIGLFLGRRDI